MTSAVSKRKRRQQGQPLVALFPPNRPPSRLMEQEHWPIQLRHAGRNSLRTTERHNRKAQRKSTAGRRRGTQYELATADNAAMRSCEVRILVGTRLVLRNTYSVLQEAPPASIHSHGAAIASRPDAGNKQRFLALPKSPWAAARVGSDLLAPRGPFRETASRTYGELVLRTAAALASVCTIPGVGAG